MMETAKKKDDLTAFEKNRMLAEYDAQELAKDLALPLVHGRAVRYRYYNEKEADEENGLYIQLDVSKDSKGEAVLRISALVTGTDRLFSNYLFEAGKTQEEIKLWLENTDVSVPLLMTLADRLAAEVWE